MSASLQLLYEFQRYGGERVVVAGTCAEYDWASGRCFEATTPLAPTTLYGSSKHALRLMLDAFAGETGMSSTWGRIFCTYGPHEHPARLVSSVVSSLLSGQPAHCTAGTHARDFLFVEDVADAFVSLLRSDVCGAVNIASGVPVTIQSVVLQIADLLNARDLVRLGSMPLSPEEPEILFGDVSRLRNEVVWQPHYSLATGLEQTIRWWRQHLSDGLPEPQIFG